MTTLGQQVNTNYSTENIFLCLTPHPSTLVLMDYWHALKYRHILLSAYQLQLRVSCVAKVQDLAHKPALQVNTILVPIRIAGTL